MKAKKITSFLGLLTSIVAVKYVQYMVSIMQFRFIKSFRDLLS